MSTADSAAQKPGKRPRGYTSHRPDCQCRPCQGARRRAEEAVTFGAGNGRGNLDSNQDESETILGVINGPIAKITKADGTVEILDANAPPEVLKEISIGGNSARDRVGQWILFRAKEPGITNSEVARRLGIAPGTLNTVLMRARREGWLKIEDPLDRIEYELLPKIVNNLNTFLDKGDRTVTIEAAKGVLFPQYRESKGITENKIAVLGINIQMPEGEMGETPMRRGAIMGAPKPAAIEAEIISGKAALPAHKEHEPGS